MTQLISLSFSPWSEKARWALDHHRVARQTVEHVPMVGEPYLRWKLRKLTGRVTVPVLIDRGRIFADSFDIARHADVIGSGSKLFPAGHENDIARWNERSDAVLGAGRVLSLRRTLANAGAIQESMPFPRAIRPHLLPLGRNAVAYMIRKYRTEGVDDAHATTTIRTHLGELRDALGGKPHLIGDALSYADIVMAVSLQLVAPGDDRYIRLGPETRACCTCDDVVREFPDLVSWRDELYRRYR